MHYVTRAQWRAEWARNVLIGRTDYVRKISAAKSSGSGL